MTVDNLEERLGAMQESFNEAKADAPGGSGPMPPDGKYQALIHEFDFFESGQGEAFLKTRMQIALDKDWEGTIVETVHNLENPERLGWLKAHLSTLGLDVENFELSALIDRLPELLDVPVAIAIKRSSKKDEAGNHWVNVFLNDRLGDPMRKSTDLPVESPKDSPKGTPVETNPDDDVPFAWRPDEPAMGQATSHNPFT